MDPQLPENMAQGQLTPDQMMQQQLLQQLRDIQAPEAIGWWPLAPGWWILAALVLGAIIWLGFALHSRHRRTAYKREALALCDQSYAEFESNQNIAAYLRDVNQLLRRVALQAGSSASTAKLSGSKWIEYLNRQGATPLSQDTANALSELLYHPHPKANVSEVNAEVRRWIESHSVQGANRHV